MFRLDRFQKALNNLDLICDYLENESKDSDDDCRRKGKLYELFKKWIKYKNIEVPSEKKFIGNIFTRFQVNFLLIFNILF